MFEKITLPDGSFVVAFDTDKVIAVCVDPYLKTAFLYLEGLEKPLIFLDPASIGIVQKLKQLSNFYLIEGRELGTVVINLEKVLACAENKIYLPMQVCIPCTNKEILNDLLNRLASLN